MPKIYAEFLHKSTKKKKKVKDTKRHFTERRLKCPEKYEYLVIPTVIQAITTCNFNNNTKYAHFLSKTTHADVKLRKAHRKRAGGQAE